MRDVAERCGEEVAAELSAKLPGVVVHVPAEMSEETLLRFLDPPLAAQLIAAFAGDMLYVSKRRTVSRESAVKALYEAGMSPKRIALKLGISQRRVQQLNARSRASRRTVISDRQLKLL
jgi:DNA-binding NarL/FixJ family response regulator